MPKNKLLILGILKLYFLFAFVPKGNCLLIKKAVYSCTATLASLFEPKSNVKVPTDLEKYLIRADSKVSVIDNSKEIQTEGKLYRGMMLKPKDLKLILRNGFIPTFNIKNEVNFTSSFRRALGFALNPGENVPIDLSGSYLYVVFEVPKSSLSRSNLIQRGSSDFMSHQRIPAYAIEKMYLLNSTTNTFEKSN